MSKNEIFIFEDQNVKLKVNMKDETVWLTQRQISFLFGKGRTTITEHINNIFKEDELSMEEVCRNFRHTADDGKSYIVKYYNLDVIISVGYRVKSKRGIIFRRWANKILKEYLIKGYSVNQRRLECLEKTVKLIDIVSRIDDNLKNDEATGILKVIEKYSTALNLLDNYDHKILNIVKGTKSDKTITYIECINLINTLKFNETSDIFALERNYGLKTIINDIYQTFDGMDVYVTVEEKASNFLYMIVKNHVFIDGNKRIGATLFIYFLQFYNILYKDNKRVIDNNTLVALTLLIAESNPQEKDILINLIMNFLK